MLEYSKAVREIAPSDEALDVSRATIVIVDDEPINVDVVQAFLEEQGYARVVTLTDASRTMQVLEETRPDLLLLDLMMPEVSGFEVLTMVREHQKLRYLPVIILTASSDVESRHKALGLGATDFLAKPLDACELGLRVRNNLWAKAYQDQLAYYDVLTKLPNRRLFLEELAWAVRGAVRHGETMALLCIEIDNFDRFNDIIGHDAGDEILQIVAQRIQQVTRDADVLARSVGGDPVETRLFHLDRNVYSLLLPRLREVDSAAVVAERILREMHLPVKVAVTELYATLSIGIASCPNESDDPSELLRLASSAKDFAKSKGGKSFQFSSPAINEMYCRRLTVETSLRKAMEKQELQLHYQPKIDIRSGAIAGVEALIRWQGGDIEVSPAEFIPLAEESGLIIPIGEWCLREACRQLKEWHASGKQPINMSVNLSAKQFANAEFMASLKEIILASGVDTNYLTLELTESLLIDNADEKLSLLENLKEIGIKFSIDDFGTGYSSLSYLRKLPVSELKIDRSFIREVGEHANSRAIVSIVVYLAKKLGLQTVAEGVETSEELDFLCQLDCDQYQGHLFSKALTAGELFLLLQDQA